MLKRRLITAAGMLAAFSLGLYFLSAQYFSASLVPIVLIAGWEWSNLTMIQKRLNKVLFLLTIFVLVSVTGSYLNFFGAIDLDIGRQLLWICFGLWIFNLFLVMTYPSSDRFWFWQPYMSLMGLMLLVFTWISIVIILARPNGNLLLLLGISVVIAADAGAYFGGKWLGDHKLSPKVSPGKTWEGLACGLICQIPICILFVYFLPEASYRMILFLILPVALFSVLGDLFESMLKRKSGFKDSGTLLPGHGGLLDRIDGYMASLPLYALILSLRPL